MSKPQQRELDRSGHTPADQGHLEETAMQDVPRTSGRTGRVPPGNRPGHHPDVEQDKPAVAERTRAKTSARKKPAGRS